jgi:hypothetical protein
MMPNVRLLVIRSQGCYDIKIKPSLEISMPKLKILNILDVAFSKVIMNKELRPGSKNCSCRASPTSALLL